jgi:hypothetical protein
MGETAMGKHVGKQLINMEIRSQKEMQPQDVVQPISRLITETLSSKGNGSQKHQHIDD